MTDATFSPSQPNKTFLSQIANNIITFSVVDNTAVPGAFRSADQPSPYICLGQIKKDLRLIQGGKDKVITAPSIWVMYTFPLNTHGPTPEEKNAFGWLYEERPPNNKKYFSRSDLALAIALRYYGLYAMDSMTSCFMIQLCHLCDLCLCQVKLDAETGIYRLDMKSLSPWHPGPLSAEVYPGKDSTLTFE